MSLQGGGARGPNRGFTVVLLQVFVVVIQNNISTLPLKLQAKVNCCVAICIGKEKEVKKENYSIARSL